jgi:hypothetical protein
MERSRSQAAQNACPAKHADQYRCDEDETHGCGNYSKGEYRGHFAEPHKASLETAVSQIFVLRRKGSSAVAEDHPVLTVSFASLLLIALTTFIHYEVLRVMYVALPSIATEATGRCVLVRWIHQSGFWRVAGIPRVRVNL